MENTRTSEAIRISENAIFTHQPHPEHRAQNHRPEYDHTLQLTLDFTWEEDTWEEDTWQGDTWEGDT